MQALAVGVVEHELVVAAAAEFLAANAPLRGAVAVSGAGRRSTAPQRPVATRQVTLRLDGVIIGGAADRRVAVPFPLAARGRQRATFALGVVQRADDQRPVDIVFEKPHQYSLHDTRQELAFVQQISDEDEDEDEHYPVVLAIISISRGLNLGLVAKGVETEVQARYLRAHRCSTMQGFLFHRPIPLGASSTRSIRSAVASARRVTCHDELRTLRSLRKAARENRTYCDLFRTSRLPAV